MHAYNSVRSKQEVESELSDIAAQIYMEDKLKKSLQQAETHLNNSIREIKTLKAQIPQVTHKSYSL
jgi:prefoldin subunit 5